MDQSIFFPVMCYNYIHMFVADLRTVHSQPCHNSTN